MAKRIQQTCQLFYLTNTKEITVIELGCACGNIQRPCAKSVDVVDMGKFLVKNDVLRAHLKSFLIEGQTHHAFYRSWAWDLISSDGCMVLSYQVFLHAWYEFLKLLDINSYIEDGYRCPLCLNAPEIIVCDGITLGLGRQHLPKKATETTNADEPIYCGRYVYEYLTILKCYST